MTFLQFVGKNHLHALLKFYFTLLCKKETLVKGSLISMSLELLLTNLEASEFLSYCNNKNL